MIKRILLASILLGCLSLSGGGAQSSSVFLQALSFVGIIISAVILVIFIRLILKSMGCLPALLIFCAIIVFVMYSFGMLNNGIEGIPDAVQVFLGQKKQPQQQIDPMAEISLKAQQNVLTEEQKADNIYSNEQANIFVQTQEKAKEASTNTVSVTENFGETEIVAPALGIDDEKFEASEKIPEQKTVAENKPIIPQQQEPVNLLADLPVIYGPVKVINSDLLYIRGRKIRLYGIDGPEPYQTCTDQKGRSYNCGQEASMWLKDWLGSHEVECRILDQDKQGTMLGVCFLGEYDIAAALVNAGLAFAYTNMSEVYVPYEVQAREDGRGLWRGTFYKPWDWRKIQAQKPKIKIIQKKKRKSLLDV